jgi:hypothetical protein
MPKKIIQQAFFLALGEVAYISLVALFMTGIEKLFSDKPDPAVVAPVAFLLLFVISAAVSGALILGKPVMLFLEGQKKEALQLFGCTVAWLVVFLMVAFGIVAMQ